MENKNGLYIRLTKVGSTSLVVKHEINKNFHERVWICRHDSDLRDSDVRMSQRTKYEIGEKTWHKLFKFATVRNPYERIVSSWRYLIVNENCLLNLKNPSYFRNLDFKSFVKKLSKTDIENPYNNECFFENRNTIDFWWHLSPQYQQLSDVSGNLLVDFMIRFENYQSDFEYVCNKLNIEKYNLLHKKKSNHKHYTDYYDDETFDLVTKIYSTDLTELKYGFE